MEKYTLAEKSKLLIDETVEAARNRAVNSTQYERPYLLNEIFGKYDGTPQPIHLGYTTGYLLENVSCPIEDYDILLGRVVDKELTAQEEAKYQECVQDYGKKMYPLNDGGHITFDWEPVIELGISGYIAKSAARLEAAIATGECKGRIEHLIGMNLVYKAYRRYIIRYGEAARARDMDNAAQICFNIADNPPKTFKEAIQLLLFITHIYSVYSACANATLSMGRVDDYLYKFYKNDIDNGTLTREDAGYIIDDFNCKLALVLGRGEHQMSGGTERDTGWTRNPMYDSPTYAMLGGYSNHRQEHYTELTKLFLERIHPRLENPVYVLRRTKDVPDDIWEIACDKLRLNSTLLVYNDETMIPALEKTGIKHEDAVNYTIHGCNWIDIQGKGRGCKGNSGIIPKYIMRVLWDADGNPVKDYQSMDDVYAAVGDAWRVNIQKVFEEYRNDLVYPQTPSVPRSLTVTDCFMQNTIDKMANWPCASEYPMIYAEVRNIGTAADILAGLEDVVFKKKAVSFAEMGKILKANFEGYEDIYKLCKNAPKYGDDNEIADAHAVRMMSLLTDIQYEEMYNHKTGKNDVYCTSITITDMWHVGEGRSLGASPDGRLAGEPLSENLSPSAGHAQSVTALLNSVSKLPLDRICSGALNVRMPKGLVAEADGLERLKIILETYFENGGMQVQLSIADTDELRDAQLHPEKYPDLMVRITGYSAVFVDMCTKAQNEIIRRDEVS